MTIERVKLNSANGLFEPIMIPQRLFNVWYIEAYTETGFLIIYGNGSRSYGDTIKKLDAEDVRIRNSSPTPRTVKIKKAG